MSAMAVKGRKKFDERDELLRAAAAQRLGGDPQVVVLRQSDEQIRKQAEAGEPILEVEA